MDPVKSTSLIFDDFPCKMHSTMAFDILLENFDTYLLFRYNICGLHNSIALFMYRIDNIQNGSLPLFLHSFYVQI